MKEIELSKAISITELAKLAPAQFAAWGHLVDAVNEIEYAINDIDNEIAVFRLRLQDRLSRAKATQTCAWNELASAANAAFDANKSKI
jgi:hypothetical protein